MTFYLTDDPKPGPANPAPAPNAGTMEVLGAAWDAEGIESDAWQRSDRVRREVVGEIEARIGGFEADTPVQAPPDVADLGLEPQYQSYAQNDAARRPYLERQVLARAGRFAAQRPADYGGLPLDEAQLEAEVNRRLRAEWEEDQAVLQTGGFGAGLAEFGARRRAPARTSSAWPSCWPEAPPRASAGGAQRSSSAWRPASGPPARPSSCRASMRWPTASAFPNPTR
jgi:hypothetical protein